MSSMRGRVVRVDETTGRPHVEVPSLGAGYAHGPLEIAAGIPPLAPGDRVVVTSVSAVTEDLVVIASLGPDAPSGDYVTPAELATALEPYALDTDLTAMSDAFATMLEDYYTETEADSRFPRKVTLAAVGSATWIRVASINGGSAAGGAAISLLISGQGLYSQASRVTDTVHFGQRGDNVYHWEAWRSGSNTAPWQYLVKQVSTYVFELWARRNGFDPLPQVQVLASHNATLLLDSATTVLPPGLTALSTPVQSAAASHVHTAADVNAGVLDLARLPVAPSGNSNATQVVRADDARLSNARTPTAHSHAASDTTSGTFAIARLPVAASGVSSSTQVVRADDSRLGRMLPVARFGGHLVRTQSVGIGQLLTVHALSPGSSVPAGATTALVAMECTAHAAANAACTWTPIIRLILAAGGHSDVSATMVSHNEGNPALNIGYSFTTIVDVRTVSRIDLYTNCANDAGSGAGIHPGWMKQSVTYLS